jgi:SAM-dependent methyltransferase
MDVVNEAELPGAGLDVSRMPGHWLLARLGKRVLRPGGLELTREMLDLLNIGLDDDVVELAPGLGVTTRLVLARRPASFTAVERDRDAAAHVSSLLTTPTHRCVMGRAEHTGLEDGSATVVFGEAMLSMQTPKSKLRITGEARRILRPGGRYGIHELALSPDSLDEAVKLQVEQELSAAIHVGARPLTCSEWTTLLEGSGFRVVAARTSPMHLLEPARLVADEGLERTLRIMLNIARDRAARARVLAMRRTFRKWQEHLCAVSLVAERVADA